MEIFGLNLIGIVILIVAVIFVIRWVVILRSKGKTRPWAMFPKPEEQKRIVAMPVEELAIAMIVSHGGGPQLGVSAVYDLLYAAEDAEKAEALLRLLAQICGTEVVAESVALTLLVRVHIDGAESVDQEEFQQLCGRVLEREIPIPEPTPEQEAFIASLR